MVILVKEIEDMVIVEGWGYEYVVFGEIVVGVYCGVMVEVGIEVVVGFGVVDVVGVEVGGDFCFVFVVGFECVV